MENSETRKKEKSSMSETDVIKAICIILFIIGGLLIASVIVWFCWTGIHWAFGTFILGVIMIGIGFMLAELVS